jgi:hypothetical protein
MEHGTVTSVTYKDGVAYCNVRAIRIDTEYRNVPVLKSHPGIIEMPKQGMKVAMEQLEDGTRFITNVISKEDAYPDEMEEGELTIQLDNETRISFEETQDGDYNLHLNASGDVFINGTKQ